MVERQAELLFRTLPGNAVVVTFGDLEVTPLSYFRYVERWHPDFTLPSLKGIACGKRLYSPFAREERRTQLVHEFVQAAQGPVFFDLDQLDSICGSCGHRFHAHVTEAVRIGVAPGRIELLQVREAEEHFRHPTDRSFPDARKYRHRGVFREHHRRCLGLLAASGHPETMKSAALPVGLMEKAERVLPRTRLTKKERGLFFFLRA